MTETNHRCVITGLGAICAIGNDVPTIWQAATKGKCGIAPTTTVDTTNCYANLAAEVKDDSLSQRDNASQVDRVVLLCQKATEEALADADGAIQAGEENRVSVILGSCVGGGNSVEAYCREGKKEDILKMPISALASQIAYQVGAKGVVQNIGNACAAGTMSIAYACDLIRAGKADVVLAGGADTFSSVPYAGFLSLHALAEKGCSPFNRCDGITLGEGAGVVVVESYAHAKKRNAKVYCEVLGSGISADAHHITAPRPDGEGQMFAIETALATSGLTPSDVDYINAHGTGTAKNDEAEFLSLHTVFDETNHHLSVSSTKAMVGHCLGAAGAVEAVFSVKALTENVVPPTIGFSEKELVTLQERAGQIDFTPNTAKAKDLTTVMSNSFAFGGNNASILFSKEEGSVQHPQRRESIYVTGIGAVLPTGNSIEDFVQAYLGGERPKEGVLSAKVAKEDYDRAGLKMAFYRKLDTFSQLQAVSGMFALQDGDYTITEENAQKTGAIVGTAAGPIGTILQFQQQLLEDGNAAGSAFRFPNTVYNAAGGYLSICSGIKGYNATLASGSSAGLYSLGYGLELLRSGKVTATLATGTDETSDTILQLYKVLGMVGKHPQKGMVLSGGSVSLLLETASSMETRKTKRYAKVLGYGSATCPVSYGTIAGAEDGLARAISLALQDAHCTTGEIDGIVTMANGLPDWHQVEQKGLTAIFGGDHPLPLFTVKQTVGEGRAVTATLSVALAGLLLSKTLEQAPTVTGERITTDKLHRLLVIGGSFGGSFTAVVLEEPEEEMP